MTPHDSDCAVHNAPAFDPGPCDCGADDRGVDLQPDRPAAPDYQDQ